MRHYYSGLIDKLIVIKRPPFRASPEKKSWKEPHKDVSEVVKGICSNNSPFKSSEQLLKETQFNFFKIGDNAANERITKAIENIMLRIHRYIREGVRVYKMSLLRYMENILTNTKWNI